MIFRRKVNSGFTLVELLVTISIFVILTGIVLFSQSKFNSTILLTNLAYDTAITIRQAQTYGINIREFNLNNDSYFVPYGVRFDKTANKSFILFADLNYDTVNRITDGIYNGKTGSDIPDPTKCQTDLGCVNRYSIKRGNYISKIEVTQGGATTSVNVLDIVFKRPDPDAIIYGEVSGVEYEDCAKATIYLTSVDGVNTKRVNVQANGLIEVVK